MDQAFYHNLKLGILGGGQLGRMLIQAAIDFNLYVKVVDKSANSPCKGLAHEFVQGDFTDYDTVYAFGKGCDLITIEIENVNAAALKTLQAEGKRVFPDPAIIELIQDKRTQKQFFQERGIPTSPFILTDTREDVAQHAHFLPAVHKSGKAGYDGKGVQVLKTESDIPKAFDVPGVLEKFVNFEREVSVIVARNEEGEIKVYPAVEMQMNPDKNLVEVLFAPAFISPDMEYKARKIARKIVTELDYVGLLAVEMFVTPDGEVLVNELAPRPHNSGHQTIKANATSQYEQHLRAILNLPLGATRLLCPTAMVNILGAAGHKGLAKYEGIEEILKIEGVYPNLYGKAETRPFRKMGHVTILDPDPIRLREKADRVNHELRVISWPKSES